MSGLCSAHQGHEPTCPRCCRTGNLDGSLKERTDPPTCTPAALEAEWKRMCAIVKAAEACIDAHPFLCTTDDPDSGDIDVRMPEALWGDLCNKVKGTP